MSLNREYFWLWCNSDFALAARSCNIVFQSYTAVSWWLLVHCNIGTDFVLLSCNTGSVCTGLVWCNTGSVYRVFVW